MDKKLNTLLEHLADAGEVITDTAVSMRTSSNRRRDMYANELVRNVVAMTSLLDIMVKEGYIDNSYSEDSIQELMNWYASEFYRNETRKKDG
jgi:hypothetical protein